MDPTADMQRAPIVGVDGGGTGCRARVYGPDGAPLAEAKGGPSNLQTGGPDAIANVLNSVDEALRAAGFPPAMESRPRVGLGLAGFTPDSDRVFAAANPPFSDYCVISDSHAAALGAHAGADGGVAMLGTGAVACVVKAGKARVIGGWGFRVDDMGSGADIGRRALRAALRAHDGPGAPHEFAARVMATFEGDVWRAAEWAINAKPWEFAKLAPLVFELDETGDATARSILDRATVELRRLIDLIEIHGADRISVSGSIAKRLAPRLPEDVQGRISPLLGDAMDGAALAIQSRATV